MRCPTLLTLAEVSVRLGKSKRWIRETLVNKRVVDAVRLDPKTVKISEESLAAWLASRTTKAHTRHW